MGFPTIKKSCNCKSSILFMLLFVFYTNLGAQCFISFFADDTVGCTKFEVTFMTQGSGATNLSWNFEGGSPKTATGAGPHLITYLNHGEFDVELTYNCDKTKNSILREDYIKVLDCSCIADFQANKTMGCIPYNVTFTDNSPNADMHWWDFEGGSPASATGAGPHTVTYNNAGKFDVKLDIACGNDKDTVIRTDFIEAFDCNCSADFSGSPLSGTAPLTVTFTDLSPNAVGWNWNFPGGDPSMKTGAGPHLVTYNNPGDYDVELAVDCSDGQSTDSIKKEKYVHVDVGQDKQYDFGDAPDSYGTSLQNNGARHIIHPDYYLGKLVDAEEDALSDSSALGDDLDGVDDEDGVFILEPFVIGDTALVQIDASANGFLGMWVDYNQDGTWDNEAEKLLPDYQVKEGKNLIKIIVPETAKPGDTFGRFRYSNKNLPTFDGEIMYGEVEDIIISVFEFLPKEYGDAPEGVVAYPSTGVIGEFPTCKDIGLPDSYVRHNARGQMYWGYEVDFEYDGNAGNPDFSEGYDQDEATNSRLIGPAYRTFTDAGLQKPHAYTLLYQAGELRIHPSGHRYSAAILGEPGETIEWGDYFDMEYHVNTDEGAWINILIDWNQDGEWRTSIMWPSGIALSEHVVRNFRLPSAGSGLLSELPIPAFEIGPNPGYVWARFTISDNPVDNNWDGSGQFSDGETEDYLLRISWDGLYDYGDAPDGALAYPESGVIGRFPTCDDGGETGFVRHGNPVSSIRFGHYVDYESGGNGAFCPHFTPAVYDKDEKYFRESYDYNDAGLKYPLPYNVRGAVGSEYAEPHFNSDDPLPTALGVTGQLIEWGEDIDVYYRNVLDPAYVNLLVDWNQNGEWDGLSIGPGGVSDMSEHVIRNFELNVHRTGLLSATEIPDFTAGPDSGLVWARLSITDEPVPLYWDGSGIFETGETEDYLLYVKGLTDKSNVSTNLAKTPQEFQLLQNYPNPFNPTTTIEYHMKAADKVVLRVFDLLGNQVAELVNERKEAGIYKVEFDGKNLPSGLYVYQIQIGSVYAKACKLILMK